MAAKHYQVILLLRKIYVAQNINFNYKNEI